MKYKIIHTGKQFNKELIKNLKSNIKFINNPTYYIDNIIMDNKEIKIYVGDSDYENYVLTCLSPNNSKKYSYNLGGSILIKSSDNKYLLTIRGGNVISDRGITNISAGGVFTPNKDLNLNNPKFIEKSIRREISEELSPIINDKLEIKLLGIYFSKSRNNKPDLIFIGESQFDSKELTDIINENKNKDYEFDSFFFLDEKEFLNNEYKEDKNNLMREVRKLIINNT